MLQTLTPSYVSISSPVKPWVVVAFDVSHIKTTTVSIRSVLFSSSLSRLTSTFCQTVLGLLPGPSSFILVYMYSFSVKGCYGFFLRVAHKLFITVNMPGGHTL